MSVAIIEISATKFSMNGIPYLKNFLSVVTGTAIRIVNQYDSSFTLLPNTEFTEFTVDGNAFSTAIELQEALLPILFTRSNLGGLQINGNITSIDQTGDLITFTLTDNTQYQLDLSSYNQGDALSNHINDTDNPHNTNAEDIGLGNVDNTSDAEKPISDLASSALDGKADKTAIMVDINSAGSKSGLYVYGVKNGINDGNLIVGWKVKEGVSNPTSDNDFETPYGLSQ